MRKDDHLIFEALQNNQPNAAGNRIPGENAEETAEQRIAAAKQAVAQAKGQIAQAKIQGQMKHYGDGLAKALGKSENAEGQSMGSDIQNQNPASGKKYAALIVTDSGEAFMQGLDEAELKDYLGGYNTAQKEDEGVMFYSDGEDGHTVLLNQKGIEEFKRVLNSASPFFPNKHDYNSWLNSIQDEQD